jgi:glycerol-3-phosphate acyltransferase PlsY
MISVAVFPVIIIFLNRANAYILPYIILSVLLAIIIVIKHKENIVRLKNGVEHKFSFKKKEQFSE